MPNKCVLVISDLHIPYHHKDSFAFLKEVKKVFKPDTLMNYDYCVLMLHQGIWTLTP